MVGVRDTPTTDSDPYPAELRKRMIEHRYHDEDVEDMDHARHRGDILWQDGRIRGARG